MSDKMGRPTEDHKDNRITIRVNRETYERLAETGNLSEEARKMLERGIESNSLLGESWELLAKKLGITQLLLYEAIYNAVEKKILKSKEGRLFFTKGATLNPDYISIDDEIEKMGLSEKESQKLRREVKENLRQIVNRWDGVA